jgi:hypothetical protein
MSDPPFVAGLSHTTAEVEKGKNRVRKTVDISIEIVNEEYEMHSTRTKESRENLYSKY